MAHSDSESALGAVKMDTPSQTSTTHWQRNWHKYAAMLVIATLLATGAAIAFGPFAPAVLSFFATVGKVLIGAETIASLSTALSAAIAWVSVIAAPVVTFVSGWGLSKLFGLANDNLNLDADALTQPLIMDEPSKTSPNPSRKSSGDSPEAAVAIQPAAHPRLTDSQSQAESLHSDKDASGEQSDENLQEKMQEDESVAEPSGRKGPPPLPTEVVERKERSSIDSSAVDTGEFALGSPPPTEQVLAALGQDDRRMSVPSLPSQAGMFAAAPARSQTSVPVSKRVEAFEQLTETQPESPTPGL